MEGAGAVKEELPTKEAVPELCSVFAQTSMPPVNMGASKKAKSVNGLVSDANLNAGENLWHVKLIDDCKRIFGESMDETLPEESFSMDIAKCRSDSSVSPTWPYKDGNLIALRRGVAMESLQDGVCSSQDVLEESERPAGTLKGQKILGSEWKRLMASKSRHV